MTEDQRREQSISDVLELKPNHNYKFTLLNDTVVAGELKQITYLKDATGTNPRLPVLVALQNGLRRINVPWAAVVTYEQVRL